MQVSPTHLLLIIIGATSLTTLSRTWQIALMAFLAHYMALGGLVLGIGPTARSGLRILIGALVCLVLFLTVRRVENNLRAQAPSKIAQRSASEIVFRLAGIGLAAMGVFGTSIPDRFPSMPTELALASGWLIAIGLVMILVSRQVLWIGMGLLTVASGFETVYTTLDPRLVSAGLLAGGTLLLALLVALAMISANGPRNSLTAYGK